MKNKLTPLHPALQTNNDIGVQTLATQHLRNQVCRRKDENQQWQWLERERERACILKEIKYVEDEGHWRWRMNERASANRPTENKARGRKEEGALAMANGRASNGERRD